MVANCSRCRRRRRLAAKDSPDRNERDMQYDSDN
jgi:hypothetical protein